MRARFFWPLAVFGALAVLLAAGLRLDPSLLPSPLVGQPLPAFAAPALRAPERLLDQRDMHGQVALVNVWGSWCPACRAEHDILMTLAEEHGVVIYGLNYKDARPAALRWLADLGDPYRFNVADYDGRVGIEWGVYGAPETFVIDARGVVRDKYVGPLDATVVAERILPLLARLEDEAARNG